MVKKFLSFFGENKSLALILVAYIGLIISVTTWGIPNSSHPFNYHMDEWHQLQSIRSLVEKGSSNVEGAANGPMLHFMLSAVYLLPFVAFGIVKPTAIQSAVTQLDVQERLFVVLRSQTLLFGIASIIVLYIIQKKYLKINPIWGTLLFVLTPLWLSLSGYFKYDISLLFFIILSLFMILRFGQNPTKKKFILAAGCVGLATAVKITALPLIIALAVAPVLYNVSKKNLISYFVWGATMFLAVFLLLGVPDIFFRLSSYINFLHEQIFIAPQLTYQLNLDKNILQFILTELYPTVFGWIFYPLYVLSFFGCIFLFMKRKIKDKLQRRNTFIVAMIFFLFMISIVPLKIFATGNRLLVLLPFLAIFSGIICNYLFFALGRRRHLFCAFFIFIILMQLPHSLSVLVYKYEADPRETASFWLVKHVPKNTIIGIENIPIYQNLPNIVLKEHYENLHGFKKEFNFQFRVISANDSELPVVLVVTDKNIHTAGYNTSPKKDLLLRLSKEKYREVAFFRPSSILYTYFKNDLNIFLSGIVQTGTISIFIKS